MFSTPLATSLTDFMTSAFWTCVSKSYRSRAPWNKQNMEIKCSSPSLGTKFPQLIFGVNSCHLKNEDQILSLFTLCIIFIINVYYSRLRETKAEMRVRERGCFLVSTLIKARRHREMQETTKSRDQEFKMLRGLTVSFSCKVNPLLQPRIGI